MNVRRFLLMILTSIVLFGCKPKITIGNNELQADTLPLVEKQEINNPAFFDESISSFQILSEKEKRWYDYQTVEVNYDVVSIWLSELKELKKYIAKYITTTKVRAGYEGAERNIKVEIYSFEDNTKPLVEIDKNCDKVEISVHTYKTTIYGCCGAEESYELFDFKHKSIIQADNQIILGRIPTPRIKFYIGFQKDVPDTLSLGVLTFSYNSDEKFSVKILTRKKIENEFLPFSPDIEILSEDEKDKFSKSDSEYTFWSLDKISDKASINNLVIKLTFPVDKLNVNDVINIPIINGKPFGKDEQTQEVFIEE